MIADCLGIDDIPDEEDDGESRDDIFTFPRTLLCIQMRVTRFDLTVPCAEKILRRISNGC